MMLPPIFEVWRSEIVAELSDAESELAAASLELSEATELARSAAIQRRVVADEISRIGRGQKLAGAISMRHAFFEAELLKADGRLSLARQGVEAARWRIADLRGALDQLPAERSAEAAGLEAA